MKETKITDPCTLHDLSSIVDCRKPRFIGNEPFGDGECARMYLGDTWEEVITQMKYLAANLEGPDEWTDEIIIKVEMLTDAEIAEFKEI